MTNTALPETGPLELALANGRRLLAFDPEGAAEQAREIYRESSSTRHM